VFDSQNLCDFINILFPALVASDLEWAVDRRARGEGVCLGKQDLVSEKEILASVKPMVFAEHYPEIRAIFPHRSPRRLGHQAGQGPQWRG